MGALPAVWPAAALALLLSACGAESRHGTAGIRVRDSAGVEVVENFGQRSMHSCPMLGKGPRAVIRSEPLEGETRPPLFRVWGGAVLGDTFIVLLNAGTSQLLRFTTSGVYVGSLGGKGRGPGEYIGPDWLGHGGHDSLFVWDSRLRRITVLDGSGNFIRSTPVTGQRATVRGRFADGSLLVSPSALVLVKHDGAVKRDSQLFVRYDLHSGKGELLATGLGGQWVDGKEGPYSLPLGERELFIVGDSSLVMGDNRSSTLRFYSFHAALERTVSWPSRPHPIGDAERRRIIARMRRELGADRQLAAVRLPEVRPRFEKLVHDRTGSIWVGEYASDLDSLRTWLIIDRRGVLTCRTLLPTDLTVLEIGRGYVLGVVTNELGEESVILYDLIAGPT